jgi:hypothetical protein
MPVASAEVGSVLICICRTAGNGGSWRVGSSAALPLQHHVRGGYERRYDRLFRRLENQAELASIHENHVRRIEGGTANPSYLVVGRIARALGVNPSTLF